MAVLIDYGNSTSDVTEWQAYVTAVSLALLSLGGMFVDGHFYFWNEVLGMQVKTALSTLIYKKVRIRKALP